jgi:hypothetical protein
MVILPPLQLEAQVGPNAPASILPFDKLQAPLRRVRAFRMPGFGPEYLPLIEASGFNTNRRQCLDWLELAVKTDTPAAMTLLGNMNVFYLNKQLEGIDLLHRASWHNDPEALVSLGNCLSSGTGVKQDLNRALDCYLKATALGDEEGILCAVMAELSIKKELKDPKSTMKRIKPLVDKGFIPAQEVMKMFKGEQTHLH